MIVPERGNKVEFSCEKPCIALFRAIHGYTFRLPLLIGPTAL